MKKIKTLPAKTAICLIKIYQTVASPLLGKHCRFVPTCSNYAQQAIEKFGLCKGGLMAAKRILRCHPFCDGGFDPPS